MSTVLVLVHNLFSFVIHTAVKACNFTVCSQKSTFYRRTPAQLSVVTVGTNQLLNACQLYRYQHSSRPGPSGAGSTVSQGLNPFGISQEDGVLRVYPLTLLTEGPVTAKSVPPKTGPGGPILAADRFWRDRPPHSQFMMYRST